MFWMRNKENRFPKSTLIWRPVGKYVHWDVIRMQVYITPSADKVNFKQLFDTFLETAPSSDPLADFKRERQKYKALREQQGVKGGNREEITLAILDKFKNKLQSARTLASDYDDVEEDKLPEEQEEENEEEEDVNDLSWYDIHSHQSISFIAYTCWIKLSVS